MKNFWTCCGALEIALLLFLVLASPLPAKGKKRSTIDLTNFSLSPSYSTWLVGPVSKIATEKEIKQFLGLETDEQAAAFIENFWRDRGGSSIIPGQGAKAIFDQRAAEADRVFREGTNQGHRTDRGTIFVLYGEPDEIRFDPAPRGRGEFLETWEYSDSAEKGLDGKKPERFYRFVKNDGRTVLYRGPISRQLPGGGVLR